MAFDSKIKEFWVSLIICIRLEDKRLSSRTSSRRRKLKGAQTVNMVDIYSIIH